MEKLKVKHDHKLTDILKVAIFGLFLIMPFLLFLPSCTYYAVNKYAQPNEDTIETYDEKNIDFNQLIHDGNFDSLDYYLFNGATGSITNNICTVQTNGTYAYPSIKQTVVVKPTHIYYLRVDFQGYRQLCLNWDGANGVIANNLDTTEFTTIKWRYKTTNTAQNNLTLFLNNPSGAQTLYFKNLNVFDLTQMFGENNEPTIEEFDTYFPSQYYEYTLSEKQIITINTGTTTYKNIVNDINYNWQKLWTLPILNWTNNTILKQGLDNFTRVFGITNISNITNLITYELIMVAIYIVIDIVLTLFKWLTHLVGSKE